MKTSHTKCGQKRTAILTFQSANNYGAVLQAYALQQFITNNFSITTILDYHNNEIDKSYLKPNFRDFLINPKRAFFLLIQSVLFKRKNARINEFRKSYLKLTKKYDINTIHNSNNDADVFITGSDQVWNYLIIGADTSFFLDFVDSDKITCSYAASIGISDFPDNYKQIYKNCLNKIMYISVREQDGISALKKIGIEKVEIMPDPTLLISNKVWEELCIKPNIKKKYILIYKITKADKLLQFAKMISRETGLPIIYIPNDLKSGIIGSLKLDVGPREWLGYIKEAEYVITNSFHGTLFSILFGIKFFSEVSERVNPSTSRINTLLAKFELEYRTISNYKSDLIYKNLPVEKIEKICNENIKLAKDFLNEVYYKETE